MPATLGRVSAERAPRKIEHGSMVLDARQYGKFRRESKPVDAGELQLGDVFELEKFEDGAIVVTVRRKSAYGDVVWINGQRMGAYTAVQAISKGAR